MAFETLDRALALLSGDVGWGGRPVYLWLSGLGMAVALARLLWRSGRTVGRFVTGHPGSALVAAIGVAMALQLGQLGWLPMPETFGPAGTGVGAAAMGAVLTATIGRRGRTRMRHLATAASAGCGVLALAGAGVPVVAAVCMGVLGAILATRAVRRRSARGALTAMAVAGQPSLSG